MPCRCPVVDIITLQILFRAVLALVAVYHFAEGVVPKKGTTWQLPLRLHFGEVLTSAATFLAAFIIMIAFDIEWSHGFVIADIGLLVLIEYALLMPPTNSVSETGINIAGWRCPWDRYLEHDAEKIDAGHHRVRLTYRTWKFMSAKRFIVSTEGLKAIESRGVKERARRRGWKP